MFERRDGAPLHADLIASTPIANPDSASADRTAVEQHLASEGLSQDEVQARVSQLSAQDVAVLAETPDQMKLAAGSHPIVWIGIGLVIAVVVIALIDSSSQAEGPEPITPTGGR